MAVLNHPTRLMAPTPSMEWDDIHGYVKLAHGLKIAAAITLWGITVFGSAALITLWLVRQSQ